MGNTGHIQGVAKVLKIVFVADVVQIDLCGPAICRVALVLKSGKSSRIGAAETSISLDCLVIQ